MKEFSIKGLEMALEYFTERGHKDIIIFLPRHMHKHAFDKLTKWERLGHVKFTPSRFIDGKMCTSYDD
ncbi:NEDD4 binding protein 1, partial [Cichlidogyrus casuarinus]